MWETILVVVIVASAVGWFALRSWRTVSGKNSGCGCGSSCGCAQNGPADAQSVQTPESVFNDIAKKGTDDVAKT